MLIVSLFALLLVAGAAGVFVQGLLLSRLRSRHPQTWEALGRPTVFSQGDSATAVLRFLWRRDYRALDDPGFSRLAGFVRGYVAVYVVLFIVMSLVLAAHVIVTPELRGVPHPR